MINEELFPSPQPPGYSGAAAPRRPTAPAERTQADSDGSRQAVIATCRSNVLEWLSSGLITPRRAFGKYYEDTLSLRDDVVPVARVPVPAGCLDVERANLGNFPVLLELDESAVRWLQDADVGHAPTTPLAAALALHFRSEDDREEFASRLYDNVFVDRLPLVVSPELFEVSTILDTDAFKQRLQAVEEGPTAAQFRVADRLSGARALGVHAATSSATLQWFGRAAFTSASPQRTRRKLKHPHEWLALAPTLAQYRPPKNASFDERLFLAAASVFLAHDRADAWDARAALARISDALAGDDAVKGADEARWTAAGARADAVLRGDEAFVAFKAGGFRTEKALLLALVRENPNDVLDWRDEDIRADPVELMLAAVLAGLAHGRKALPLTLRPQTFDDALATRELSDINGDHASPSVAVREERGQDAEILVLTVDGRDVFSARRPPRTSSELLESLELSEPGIAETLAAYAISRGWQEAVESTVRIGGPVQLATVRSVLQIEMRGTPEVVTRLRPEEFKAAVARTDDPEVRAMLSRLAEPGGEPPAGSPAQAV